MSHTNKIYTFHNPIKIINYHIIKINKLIKNIYKKLLTLYVNRNNILM